MHSLAIILFGVFTYFFVETVSQGGSMISITAIYSHATPELLLNLSSGLTSINTTCFQLQTQY